MALVSLRLSSSLQSDQLRRLEEKALEDAKFSSRRRHYKSADNKWVLQTADRPRDVPLVEAAEELTAVCNTPSFYTYLLYPGYQSLEYSIEP